MIRPALELAWAVAKLGSQARPPVAPPGRLRPLMRFAKLPDRALSTVRQVVEEDSEFRARVTAVAREGGLEGAPWIWLMRPDGWAEDLGSLTEAADAAAVEIQAEREERIALKRLAAAEASAARAEAELAQIQQVNSDLAAEVASERQNRRRSEAEREDLEAARRSAETQLSQLAQNMTQMDARISNLAVAVDEGGRRLSEVRQERDLVLADRDQLRVQLDDAKAEAARSMEAAERTRADIGAAVARAAAAASQLGQSLADVARLITPTPPAVEVERSGPAPVAALVPAIPVFEPPRRVLPERRRPARLPPAVFDDSFEAAEYLVRLPGVLLVVDGYNVTISSWPHLELPRQRQRLVDALAELAMRIGTSVRVVFDGTDEGGRIRPPNAARHQVAVTFSSEGIDADEVIVELVDQLEPGQPVVVATDDRRVRDEVVRRGANVISVVQLLAVLGRLPGGGSERNADRGSAAR
jgi:predicted RNA-binding protein with PIN domain